jgi:hypothetical protein
METSFTDWRVHPMMTDQSDADAELPRVDPIGSDEVDAGAFEGLDTPLPYGLLHFHRIANGVREGGDNRGFIDIHVWRSEENNEPYNARIMESLLTLVCFYTRDRSWNVYYGDPAVRARLEAAFEYWVGMQHEDGRFSEYGVEEWNLASTAFATKFIGQALVYLDDGPSIDAGLHDRVVESLRDALLVTFRHEELTEHGRSYSNQYSNAFAGAGAYLSLFDDPEVEALFERRLEWSLDHLQSPAGFFYEMDAPDWSYNLGTHQSNLLQAHHYLQDTEHLPQLVEKEERWADWVAYNALLEPADPDATADDTPPDGGFFLNCAADARNTTRHRQGKGSPLHQYLPHGGAFSPSAEERDTWLAELGEDFEDSWPVIDDLVGDFWALSPYSFLHLDHDTWYPGGAERDEARERLPYVASDRFVHQHVDDRTDLVCTHVRRPEYYAIFNGAPEASSDQRFGLGILWHPDAGTVLQSRKDVRNTTYGTRTGPDDAPYEGSGLDIAYTLGDTTVDPEAGSHELPAGDSAPLTVEYPLGDAGYKSIRFGEEDIEVTVTHDGDFVESIPILASDGQLTVSGARVGADYGDTTLSVAAEAPLELAVFSTPRRFQSSASRRQSGVPSVARPIAVDKRLFVARAYSSDDLTYRLSFSE